MKRVHVLGRPISVRDIEDLEVDSLQKDWVPQKAQRARLRKWRKIKHQAV